MAFITKRHPPVDDQVDAVKDKLDEMERGELITYAELERITGFKKDDYQWSKVMGRVRRWCLNDRNIVMISERSVGYRLLGGDEQQEWAFRQIKLARRKTTRAGYAAGCVEDSCMSDTGRSQQRAIVDIAEKTIEANKVAIAKHKLVFSVPLPLPRPVAK